MMNKKTKKAFSMITAIFVIVMMTTLAALIQNVTGKTIKATTQQYKKEQAVLLARSYTELAILYVSAYDRNVSANCINTINAQFGPNINSGGYNIQTEIRYVGPNNEVNICGARALSVFPSPPANSFEETISLIIDVYVRYKDLDDPSALDANDRNISYHRRSLQKL